MRVAALDLGTNTFLLLIADVIDGQIKKVVHDEVRVIRLGQGVHQSREFHPDALARAESCFKDFSATIKKHGTAKVLACATSAARDVKNADKLVALALSENIPLKVISGEKEAEYTFSGTLRAPLTAPAIIVDTGGGSTEYILGDQSGLVARKSLDIGSVRLTELFISKHPVIDHEMAEMTSYIIESLKSAKSSLPPVKKFKMIAVAGTPTTLATLDQGLPFESDRVDGYKLSIDRVEYWVRRLADMTVEQRQALAGMEPKRADVLVAGALILLLSMREFGASELEVSTRGLRYGVAKALGEGKE
jgi:exopolyphosphatase/guanosine-5'-triphosphate,3'-diphosphate pyrophosphatase